MKPYENPEDHNMTCSYLGCKEKAIWTRKPGWMVAPGSPPGDVCEKHHCWQKVDATA